MPSLTPTFHQAPEGDDGFQDVARRLAEAVLQHTKRGGQNDASKLDSLAITEYIYCRELLALFSEVWLAEQSEYHAAQKDAAADSDRLDPKDYASRLSNAGLDLGLSDIKSMTEIKTIVPNSQGKNTPVHFAHVVCHDPDKTCWIACADPDYAGGKLISYGKKIIIKAGSTGHYTYTTSDVKIDDKVIFGGHQTYGVQTFAKKLLAGIKALGLLFATGTGKSFVMIAPAIATGKGGVFAVPNDAQINQLRRDILKLDIDVENQNILTSSDIAKDKEAETLLNHHVYGVPKYIIIRHDDMPRFAQAKTELAYNGNQAFKKMAPEYIESLLKEIPYFIDEAHEADLTVMGTLLNNGHRLHAMTATWTEGLQTIFGDPLATLDMHYALNELRAFRDIIIKKTVLPKDRLDDQVFEVLADYYGTLTYITRDNTPDGDKKYIAREDLIKIPGLLDAGIHGVPDKIAAALSHNEVRRYDHTNMAFTKNRQLLAAIAAGYQSVFDGSYPRLDELAERVTTMRTTTRIKELWGAEREIFSREVNGEKIYIGPDVPEHIDLGDKAIKQRFAGTIEGSMVDGNKLRQEAGKVLKTKIADVITRKALGVFFDTSPDLIRANIISGELKEKLKKFSDRALRGSLDPTQKEWLDQAQNPQGEMYQKIAGLLAPLTDKDRILQDLSDGNFSSLMVNASSIDLEQFPDARYATLVQPGDSAEAARTAERINQGLHVHIVGDSELATGYNNPDILSVQRLIENVIKEGVIRATQILGRCIRAKDLIAFATDFITDNLDPDGELGAVNGSPFDFGLVVNESYRELAAKYNSHFPEPVLS